MIKGFIFDIDWTLYYRSEHTVPKSTFTLLEELKKKGYKIAVCTTREKDKLKTVPHDLLEYADMVVVGSGAMAYKDYALYSANYIKQEDLNKYLDYIEEHNLSYSYTEENGKTYYWGELDDEKVIRVLNWAARMPMMKRLTRDRKIVNLEIQNYKQKDYDYLYSVNPKVTPIKWTDNFLLCAEGVDKLSGIDMFCDAFNFNRDEIVAVGDGKQDAIMLAKAGVGIAMKGSDKQAIDAADYVCEKTLEDGGLYEEFVRLGYIERKIPDLKIIFFDIDQTTFDHSIDDVRDSTIEALTRLKEKGIKLCFATSRAPDEMFNCPKRLYDLMDGVINCAGGYTTYKDEVIPRIIDDDVKGAIKYLEENNITYRYVLTNGRGYLNKKDEKIENLFDKLYQMKPPVKPYEGEEIVHLLYYTEDIMQKSKMRSILKNSSHTNFALPNEVMAKDTDKSIDMFRLAHHLGFNDENVGAFGDSLNDIDMLNRASLGVCMGNGRVQAKLAADYVTDHIEAEGLYKALVKYGYIN